MIAQTTTTYFGHRGSASPIFGRGRRYRNVVRAKALHAPMHTPINRRWRTLKHMTGAGQRWLKVTDRTPDCSLEVTRRQQKNCQERVFSQTFKRNKHEHRMDFFRWDDSGFFQRGQLWWNFISPTPK